MKRIWHISDTHCCLNQIKIPENIDIVIHSGDATNQHDPFRNEPEMVKFIERYSNIDIKNKVFVAGNHDGSVERRLIDRKDFEAAGIIYLENESVELEGFKIWGSPHTPTFGSWHFMKSRANIGMVWDSIPEDVDIVITHGPPRGILDTTYRRGSDTELCGDKSLLKRMLAIQPKLVCFGHIHDTGDIRNAGTMQISGIDTMFSNGACCSDGKFGMLTSHGNVISLDSKENVLIGGS